MANSDLLELKVSCMQKRSQSRKLFSKSSYAPYEFVLTPRYLAYYSTLGGSRGKEKGRILISCIKYVERVSEGDMEGKPFVWQVAYVEDLLSTNRFVLYIVAASAVDRDEWIATVRQQCGECGATFYPRYHPGVWQKPGRFTCCDAIHRRSGGCQATTPLPFLAAQPQNEAVVPNIPINNNNNNISMNGGEMESSTSGFTNNNNGGGSVATLLSQDLAVINLHAATESVSNGNGITAKHQPQQLPPPTNANSVRLSTRRSNKETVLDVAIANLPLSARNALPSNGSADVCEAMLQRQCSDAAAGQEKSTRSQSGATILHKVQEQTRGVSASPFSDLNISEESEMNSEATSVGTNVSTSQNIVIAIHSYNPLRCNQLALLKGEKYLVIDSSNSQWWYVRNAAGLAGYVPTSFVQKPDALTTYDWYYKDLTRQQAEAILLEENREGCFLVRDSVSRRDTYTLSVTSKDPENPTKLKVHHYHIHRGDYPSLGEVSKTNGVSVGKTSSGVSYRSMYYLSEKHAFPTINDVIHYHKHNSGGLVVRLRSPPVRDKDTPATAGMGLDEFELDPTELQCEPDLIGKGQFGVVKRGSFHGIPVAIKQMLDGAMNEEDFIEEAKNMKNLNHPNLVQLFGVVLRRRPIMIITEYMEYGSLRDFLRRSHSTLAHRAIYLSDMCAQVASGMAYLERQQFVHRDLAARNCLVKSVHGSSSVRVKVADFGMTRFLLDNVYEPSAGTKFPVRWASPEVFQSLFTSKADVWSFAVLMWEVFTCCLESPYHGKDNAQVYQYIVGGGRLSKPAVCPERLYVLMLECWQHDPNKRPTFQYICQKFHAFLDQHAENS